MQIGARAVGLKPLNYARHRWNGAVVFFRGFWRPRCPDDWASWMPVEGCPRLRRIGETDLERGLRLVAGGHADRPLGDVRAADKLLARLQDGALGDEDLTRAHA